MEVISLEASTLYPLTHPQKRIWYVENIYPGTSIHNIGGLIKIYGPIDFHLLEESINLFVKQNDAIRIRLIERDETVWQTVTAYRRRTFPFIDFTARSSGTDVDAWVSEEFAKPLPLDGEFLYEFALVKISETESAYLTKVHHMISDGWSFQLMTTQINQIYTQLMQGQAIQQEDRPSYLDYIEQERAYLSSSRFTKNKHYWQKKFESIHDVALHTTASGTAGKRQKFLLNPHTSEAIRSFVHTHRISLNTFFIAAMLIYLHQATHQDRIMIGTPVLNRTGAKEKNTFGMFTSTMPFLADIERDTPFSTFLHNINHELIQCYFHQKYPYNLLVQDLQLHKRGLDQLFQVCVNYYNTAFDQNFGPGWKMQQIEAHNGNQLYPLQLIVTEWSPKEGLELYFDYKTGDYTDSQIDEMFRRLHHIADQVVSRPEAAIRDVQLLLPGEREELLYACNRTDRDYPATATILQLFEEQVERTPGRVAAACGGQALTYSELNARANRLARTLRKSGIGPHTPAAVMGRHSLSIVVGIWAVIKAGAAYLPIDPDYPQERIEYILRDSGASHLLTNGGEWERLSYDGIVIDLDDERMYEADESNLPVKGAADDLAYIIYTSGSTGNPKGTMIEHRGLVNYIWWAGKTYLQAPGEVFALYSSIAFDLTVTSIFTPLISGHRIEIYEDDGNEFIIHRILRDNKATVIKLTPAHLALIKDIDLSASAVRTFIVGGEDLKCALARHIHEQASGRIAIYNEYGPTETVVGCMIYRFDPERDKGSSVPIGKPIDNVQIYLLDQRLEPVPDGSVGELYISGDGVARGYLHRPELTRERFMDNPFLPGKRMYRSGDLAMRHHHGDIVYLGRIDHQVKIKGYRIEMGEIEHQLLALAPVEEAVVVDRTGDDGQQHLVAYFVAAGRMADLELRMKLAEVLPSYMIPAYFVRLDHLPLTPNGKVDRRLLPAPERAPEPNDAEASGHIAALLTDIFKEVLQAESIGVRDNFYHMGGDSIKAIQIASRVTAAGFRLKVQQILSYPVIHELAAMIEMNHSEPVAQGPCIGAVKPLPITSWFFRQQWSNPHHYVQSVLVRLKQRVTAPQLQEALYRLIEHHDALRLQLDEAAGSLEYRPVEREDVEIPCCDLACHSEGERSAELKKCAESFKASMRLGQGLLFKSLLFEEGTQDQRLLLTAHHLVIDGVSWRILLEDLDRLLQSMLGGPRLPLPARTHSVQAWADAIEAYSRDRALEHLAYWQSVSAEAEDSLQADFPAADERHEGCGTLVRELSKVDTHRLLREANVPFRTQTSELLVASLAMALGSFTGKEAITIELEGHGREELFDSLDVSRTVGWFTSMYPVNLRLPDSEPAGIIKSVKEQLRSIPNKGIDYGILSYTAGRIPETGRSLLRFNYMGEIDNHLQSSVLDMADEDTGSDICASNRLSCLVDVVAIVIDKKLQVRMSYSTAKFKPKSMEAFMAAVMQRLMEVINLCAEMGQSDFTPSDFETVKLSQDELDVLFRS
ncbi:MAG: amino acid adenylation domain-containing protein [Paenibacillus dendritiformis]|uniref:amino acid adenylation domain-containing protein n=1 Tax=uncultured Paenibacillus sp. TaxID=227322 RepID=UPI0025F1798C|nr:amino acid adenylation domain-containing protein [uncultured Paenibacillus sp.]MDU5142221.1 amino acid adenylation domain-containing protein [Paenibacillus dendritiformis]